MNKFLLQFDKSLSIRELEEKHETGISGKNTDNVRCSLDLPWKN